MRQILVALMLAAAVGSMAELSDAQRMQIDQIAKEAMQTGALPSIVVLIDRGGQTIYDGAFGSANLEHGLDAGVDVPYAIGSITKSFTALAILHLVADGRIDLDQPVGRYLDGYEGPAEGIAVRHLLDHTSGLQNYTDFAELRPRFERERFSRDEMVATFADRPLAFEPGDKFSYSNSGYYLLGLIIEAASGLDYYTFLDRQVIEPLGLDATYIGNDTEVIPNRAGGYEITEAGFVNHDFWSHLVPFAAGSLVATAEDLVRYRRGVFGDATTNEVQRLVTTTNELNDGTENVYSLGALIKSRFHGHEKLSHSGDIWGFTSNHAYYPNDDLTIAILANRQAETPAMPSLENKIARIVLGIDELDIKNVELSTEELARYIGDFELHPFIFGPPIYGFSVQGSGLVIHFGGTSSGAPPLPLLAQGDGEFRASFDDEWVFRFEDDGARLTAQYRDGTFSARRISR